MGMKSVTPALVALATMSFTLRSLAAVMRAFGFMRMSSWIVSGPCSSSNRDFSVSEMATCSTSMMSNGFFKMSMRSRGFSGHHRFFYITNVCQDFTEDIMNGAVVIDD